MDISSEIQKEVARLRETIATTKALFPDRKVNFMMYELLISQAEKAVREQDAAELCKMLYQLKQME